MYKRIFVPIDLQQIESWKRVLPLIERLSDEESMIFFLGVVQDFGSSMVATFLPRDYETRLLQKMKEGIDAFVAQNFGEDPRVRSVVGHGAISDTILKQARQHGADLIIMASHNPNEPRGFFVSSHANAVVRNSPISVLVAR